MLHQRLRRLTTLGLLFAYLTASTVGGLLHDHDEHDEAVPSHGAGHLSGDVAGVNAADGHSAHDDDCTICRFLGQRSLSASIRPLESSRELSVELTLIATSQSVSPIARGTHSRAPPLFG